MHSPVCRGHPDQLRGTTTQSNGDCALSEIGALVSPREGGAPFAQLAAARGRFDPTPVSYLAECGQLDLIHGGVTAIQLRGSKADKVDDALLASLCHWAPAQIRDGVSRGVVSAAESHIGPRSMLSFSGTYANIIPAWQQRLNFRWEHG